MLTRDQIAAAARSLDEAERTRTQIGLLSLAYPAMTVDDAYAIQAAWVAGKRARGAVVRGHKIGLTSNDVPPGPHTHVGVSHEVAF